VAPIRISRKKKRQRGGEREMGGGTGSKKTPGTGLHLRKGIRGRGKITQVKNGQIWQLWAEPLEK